MLKKEKVIKYIKDMNNYESIKYKDRDFVKDD